MELVQCLRNIFVCELCALADTRIDQKTKLNATKNNSSYFRGIFQTFYVLIYSKTMFWP